jgi:hypothetical protein
MGYGSNPSCNWLFTCLVAEPGDGCVVPPLLQVPVLIELASLVVKAMGNLMANHNAWG